MSINIVKGVEFGLGFEQTRRFGSAVHDVIEGRDDDGRWVHRTNNAGGLTGGVTNGEPLVVRGAVKPISTLARPLPSADLVTGEAVDKAHYERSDISVVPAAGRRRRGDGDAHAGRRSCSRSSAATRWPRSGPTSARYRARIAPAPEAPVAGGRRAGRRPRRARPDRHATRPAPAATTEAGDGRRPRRAARERQERRRASAWRSATRAAFIDLDERDRDGRRPDDPGDLRGGRRGRLPGARARGRSPTSAPADREPRRPPGDRDRRRRRRRPAQPLGALPRPDRGLARRPARGPRPAPPPLAATSGRSSPAATRSARSRDLATRRERFYAAADIQRHGRRRGPAASSTRSRRQLAAGATRPAAGPTLLRAETPIGRFVLGDGHRRPRRWPPSSTGSARAGPILVSEPGAWAAVGERLGDRAARAAAATVESVLLPAGRGRQAAGGRRDRRARAGARSASSAASRSSRSAAARSATRPGSSPRPTCAASRSSTSRRRSSPRSTRRSAARPASTCPRARTSSARSTSRPRSSSTSRCCGRSPSASCGPRSARRSRWRPSATSGCSSCSSATARRSPAATPAAFASGAVAEVVERAGWAKVEVVLADERERGAAGGRITLNLGPLARPCLRGGGRLRRAAPRRGGRLRAARGVRIGLEVGVTPPERAERIERLLDAPRARDRAAPLPARRRSSATWPPTRSTPAGRLRWVLPTADGVVVRDDIEPADRRARRGRPAGDAAEPRPGAPR